MKVFISWSGNRSKAVADELMAWIPSVIQAVKPWASSEIPAGSRWNDAISKELNMTNFGIVCLTPANLEAPWLLFEAGALAKVMDCNVVPYCVGFRPAEIPTSNPLSQFQGKQADTTGTCELVKSINACLGQNKLADEVLVRVFEKFWPDLEKKLKNLPNETAPPVSDRDPKEVAEETLELVRIIHQELNRDRKQEKHSQRVRAAEMMLDHLATAKKAASWRSLATIDWINKLVLSPEPYEWLHRMQSEIQTLEKEVATNEREAKSETEQVQGQRSKEGQDAAMPKSAQRKYDRMKHWRCHMMSHTKSREGCDG